MFERRKERHAAQKARSLAESQIGQIELELLEAYDNVRYDGSLKLAAFAEQLKAAQDRIGQLAEPHHGILLMDLDYIQRAVSGAVEDVSEKCDRVRAIVEQIKTAREGSEFLNAYSALLDLRNRSSSYAEHLGVNLDDLRSEFDEQWQQWLCDMWSFIEDEDNDVVCGVIEGLQLFVPNNWERRYGGEWQIPAVVMKARGLLAEAGIDLIEPDNIRRWNEAVALQFKRPLLGDFLDESPSTRPGEILERMGKVIEAKAPDLTEVVILLAYFYFGEKFRAYMTPRQTDLAVLKARLRRGMVNG